MSFDQFTATNNAYFGCLCLERANHSACHRWCKLPLTVM